MVCQKCMYQGMILDESVKHAQMQCCNVTNVFFNVQSRIPEMLGRFLNLNKIKTKRLSNHMSQYFINNRT